MIKLAHEYTDEQWDNLLNPDNVKKRIDTAKREAEKEYGQLTSDEIDFLRRKAKSHLFFLSHGILGYNKLSPNLHGHFCLWIQRNRIAKRRLELMPRGHLKSTIESVSDTVQIVLPDVCGGQPYPWNLGPEARVLLGHETAVGSSRFLFQITNHFTSNHKLIGLFPEVVPTAKIQRLNRTELELPRKSFWSEPTIDTLGVGAKAQGRHYDIIKLDDIYGDKARDSKAERETTIEWFDNIESFWISARTGRLVLVGTRYSLDDIYAHAIKKYGKSIIKYIRRVREPNDKGKLVPIFPEEFPDEELEFLEKNPRVWTQYTNDPRTGASQWQESWKHYYQYNSAKTSVTVFTGTSSRSYRVRSLDITILTDPAITKLPGIVVTGTSPRNEVFILEYHKRDMKPFEYVELLFTLVQKYWPRLVTVEEAVFGKVYASWIQREMQVRGIRFNLMPVKVPNDQDKLERVGAKLSHYYSAGQIFFDIEDEGRLEQEPSDESNIIWEFNNFGATENYHLHDALSQGPEVWRPGLSNEQAERYRKLEDAQMRDIDPVTGYSRM